MDYILETVKKASIFMILAQIIVHFRPNSSYEKYFKFMTGIMTSVILIVPMLSFFQKGVGEEYKKSVQEFEEHIKAMSSRAEIKSLEAASEGYISQVETEIKSRLNQICEEDGYLVKSLEIQGISEETGEVETARFRLRIVLLKQGNSESKIEIEPVRIFPKTEKREEEERMKNKILNKLGMEEEMLEVELLE